MVCFIGMGASDGFEDHSGQVEHVRRWSFRWRASVEILLLCHSWCSGRCEMRLQWPCRRMR